jgi:hypothetical protein
VSPTGWPALFASGSDSELERAINKPVFILTANMYVHPEN